MEFETHFSELFELLSIGLKQPLKFCSKKYLFRKSRLKCWENIYEEVQIINGLTKPRLQNSDQALSHILRFISI